MAKEYFVYIASNVNVTVLYVGVTSELAARVDRHAAGLGGEFTSKYKVSRLLYFEVFNSVRDAIGREKELKGWRRAKKEDLVRTMNPRLEDLRPKIVSTKRVIDGML